MPKARISLSVDPGTVAALDREARATGANRSRFVEGLLCAAVVDRVGPSGPRAGWWRSPGWKQARVS